MFVSPSGFPLSEEPSNKNRYPQDWKDIWKNSLEMVIAHAELPGAEKAVLQGAMEALEAIGDFLLNQAGVSLEFILLWQIVKKEVKRGMIKDLIEDARNLSEFGILLSTSFNSELLLQGPIKSNPFLQMLGKLQKTMDDPKRRRKAEGIMEILNTYLMTYFQKLVPKREQLDFWDHWLDIYAAYKQFDGKNLETFDAAVKNLTIQVQKMSWTSL